MSHYCCKKCGQRYEHCHCPPASSSTVTPAVGDKPSNTSKVVLPTELPILQEDELLEHTTLGQMRMHLDFLIFEYGEDTVVVVDPYSHVELLPDPDYKA